MHLLYMTEDKNMQYHFLFYILLRFYTYQKRQGFGPSVNVSNK